MSNSIQSQMKKRIEYVDIAKAVGIILVIAGHVVSGDNIAKRIIYSFHMPLFFILSGLSLAIREKNSNVKWKKIISRKAKRLLLPYVIWGLIYSSFSFKHTALVLYGTRETLISAESLTSLWFLPVLFLAYLITEMVLRIANRLKMPNLAIAIGIAGTITIGFIIPHYPQYGYPWGLDIAFIAAAFMLIGFFLQRGNEKITNNIVRLVILIISSILFVVVVRYSNTSVGYVLMANAIYGNCFVFFANALLGSIIVLMAACLLSKFHLKCLSATGQKTLGIFVIHKPIVEAGRNIVVKLGYNYNSIIFFSIITVVTFIISYFMIKIIHIIIPEIIGTQK